MTTPPQSPAAEIYPTRSGLFRVIALDGSLDVKIAGAVNARSVMESHLRHAAPTDVLIVHPSDRKQSELWARIHNVPHCVLVGSPEHIARELDPSNTFKF